MPRFSCKTTSTAVLWRSSRVRWAAVLAAVGAVLLVLAGPAGAATVTFSFTGAAQSWTVPAGVTSATFDVFGAQGSAGSSGPDFGPGGLGGRATVTVAVTPGQTYQINVGGAGSGITGGFNGGANGGLFGAFSGGGGGGASDVRSGAFGLANRVVVAGGGGGGGNTRSFLGGGTQLSFGGTGGGLTGGNGGGTGNFPAPGTGGTQTAGGDGGGAAADGVFGAGGAGACASISCGGGGGGGWWGGGGGEQGAGGGSGFGPAGVAFESGVRTGNGQVTVTFTAPTTIADVRTLLAGLNIHHGIKKALDSKLRAAQAALQRNNKAAACGPLKAFLNQVRAQSGKKLTAAQATQLSDAVKAVRTTIGC